MSGVCGYRKEGLRLGKGAMRKKKIFGKTGWDISKNALSNAVECPTIDFFDGTYITLHEINIKGVL